LEEHKALPGIGREYVSLLLLQESTRRDGLELGVWWLPNATVTGYLVLTNQGQNPLQTTLSVSDAAGKTSTQTITVPRENCPFSNRDHTWKQFHIFRNAVRKVPMSVAVT